MTTIRSDETMRYLGPEIIEIRPELLEERVPRLRYGGDGPPVKATSSGRDGTISGEMLELAEMILDALQQLPVFKFAESLMATKGSRPGDATAVRLDEDGPTPAPSAMQTAKPVARDPQQVVKHSKAPATPKPQPQAAVAPQPVRYAKSLVEPAVVQRYSRLLNDAKDQRLTYAKRESSLLEARKIHSTTTKAIAAQAVKRSLVMKQSYEKSLMELGESPLSPLPATLDRSQVAYAAA